MESSCLVCGTFEMFVWDLVWGRGSCLLIWSNFGWHVKFQSENKFIFHIRMKRVLNKTQSSSIFTMHGLPHLIQYCCQILPGVLHLKLVQQADLVERGLQHSRTRSCWPLPRIPPSPPSPSSQRVPDGHQEIKALDQSFPSTIVRDPLSLVGISARLVIEDLLRRYLLVCAGAIWDC